MKGISKLQYSSDFKILSKAFSLIVEENILEE